MTCVGVCWGYYCIILHSSAKQRSSIYLHYESQQHMCISDDQWCMQTSLACLCPPFSHGEVFQDWHHHQVCLDTWHVLDDSLIAVSGHSFIGPKIWQTSTIGFITGNSWQWIFILCTVSPSPSHHGHLRWLWRCWCRCAYQLSNLYLLETPLVNLRSEGTALAWITSHRVYI